MTIKQGDTRNGIIATLSKDGEPVNLTDHSVRIYFDNGVSGRVEVLEAEKGLVMYPLEASAVADEGYLSYEFKVTYADKRRETFPNDGYLTLKISESMEEW